jgi:hypothetical protein
MKKTIYCCDRCGEEIQDMVYTLTCYVELVPSADPVKNLLTQLSYNIRQNEVVEANKNRHLCCKCKDKITDGIFIV